MRAGTQSISSWSPIIPNTTPRMRKPPDLLNFSVSKPKFPSNPSDGLPLLWLFIMPPTCTAGFPSSSMEGLLLRRTPEPKGYDKRRCRPQKPSDRPLLIARARPSQPANHPSPAALAFLSSSQSPKRAHQTHPNRLPFPSLIHSQIFLPKFAGHFHLFATLVLSWVFSPSENRWAALGCWRGLQHLRPPILFLGRFRPKPA